MLRAAVSYGRFHRRVALTGMRQPLRHRGVLASAKEYCTEALRWHRTWSNRRTAMGRPPGTREGGFVRSQNPAGAIIQAAKALGHAVTQGDKEAERAMIKELLKYGREYARTRDSRKKPGRAPTDARQQTSAQTSAQPGTSGS